MLTKERRIKEKTKQIMKQLKNNKEEKNIMKNKGISLITLVITIIIMIILAGAIILTLTNSGIFDKANDAVSKYSLKQVQAIADLAWAEAYADNIRDKDGLQKAVDKALEDNDLDDKYKAVADEKGVTVTEKVESAASNWVSEYTDEGVPIPLGFVASPYDGTDGMPAENTKAGGLVIYELKEGETSTTDIREADKAEYTDLKDIHYNSMETRNQFVWVPVNKDNFKDEFVRDSFGQKRYIEEYDPETANYIKVELDIELSNKLGEEFWELVLDKDNMPSQDTENDNVEDYVSSATLAEATEMYKSVAEYGGFYIARYEVGYADKNNKVPSITMGKYPYHKVLWSSGSSSMKETANDGGSVALSRAFYPKDNNDYGVVSTLTYGVQWDTTLNWWTGKDLTDSTSYGNHYNTSIEEGDYNQNAQYSNAQYSEDYGDSWNEAVAKEYDEENNEGQEWLLTTGAFKNANVNNIYDMAGNLREWTMEANSNDYRVARGGSFAFLGSSDPVTNRFWTPDDGFGYFGFRPSLYIKVK